MRVNRIRALAALTAVVFACGDGGAQPADPADPRLPDKELVIGTKEAPPFAMKQPDGSWRGISIDLWRRVAERSDGIIQHSDQGTPKLRWRCRPSKRGRVKGPMRG